MRREIAITVYLAVFRFLFQFFNRFPIQNKTVFVASFGGNIQATLKELEKQIPDHEVVIIKSKNCHEIFSKQKNRTILHFNYKNLLHCIKSIYHLATSSHVFIDNYYGFLAATDFKPQVTCIQLWHAAGAIKQFGLEDLTNDTRTDKALARFRQVYDRFDRIVVGSDKMSTIFKKSFGLPEERIMRTGVPRTDFFFDDLQKRRAENQLLIDFPILSSKRAILYAPTYRDDELNSTQLHLDLDKMYEHFRFDYVLFLRLHPAVNSAFENKYPGFIYNVSSYPSINHLMLGTDVLITDYSSIPFEFSLLNKPMIFYAPDLEEYAKERGVWNNYQDSVPGPVVKTTTELINTLQSRDFQLEKVTEFANEWNKYSTGNSCVKLIHALYELETTEQTEQIREHV